MTARKAAESRPHEAPTLRISQAVDSNLSKTADRREHLENVLCIAGHAAAPEGSPQLDSSVVGGRVKDSIGRDNPGAVRRP